MRKWIGAFCVFLGVVCLLGSIGFVAYNRWESDSATKFAQSLLGEVQARMNDPDIEPDNAVKEMPTIPVDGYECIGVLSVPVLELELPILTDWSYVKLKKAPCLYYGSYFNKDFVIAAHNYKSHFGRLSELQVGDTVVFTNVMGEKYYYEVVLLETLPAAATEEMITSGFDLSLYTCTTGGGSRVTARCKRVQKKP